MFGAPHTTRSCAVAEVDVGEADAVGVGVRRRRRGSCATTTPLISRPGSSIASTSRPSWFSAAAMSAGRRVDRRELADPGERRAHRSEPQNCARKRTSPSQNVLHVVDAVAAAARCARGRSRTRSRCTPRGRCRRPRTRWGRPCPQPPSSIQPVCEHTRQPVAVAEDAAHRELGRRLGEREEDGQEARR